MTKRPSRVRRFLLAFAATFAVVALVGWNVCWRSPPFFTDYEPVALPAPILTMAQYGQLQGAHPRPYVVDLAIGTGHVVLYGAEHSLDPAHPQVDDIGTRWRELTPTVALVEGRLGFLVGGLQDPVAAFGEGGAVAALARGDGVPLWSWEPPREREVSYMIERHDQERVALFYVLRPYLSGYRHGRPADPDAFVEDFRARRTAWPGLEGTLPNVAAIDAVWKRDFAAVDDWRDTSDEYGLPGYFDDMYADANAARDDHFAQVLLTLAHRGERVFAVAGSSHAVKLAPTLRAATR